MTCNVNDDYHKSLQYDEQTIRFVDVKKWDSKIGPLEKAGVGLLINAAE